MNRHFKLVFTFIFIGLLSASCGSSSSGGGSGNPGSGGSGSGSGGTSRSLLFFKSGSISSVDPDNPNVAPIVIESGTTIGETKITAGTLDLANKTISDIHNRHIVYANPLEGKLYKISALKSDSQTPVQISNESTAFEICETDELTDFTNANKSVFFYQQPGADRTCNTSDDTWKMVPMDMESSSSPIAALKLEQGFVNLSTGALDGFLAFSGNTLVHCDLNFQNCSNIISFTSRAENLSNNFSGDTILRVDDQLFHYSSGSQILSQALHTLSGTGTSSSEIRSDGTTMYFRDGNQIFSLPMDGNSLATPLTTEIGKTIIGISLKTNKVAYITKTLISPVSFSLKTVDRLDSATATLISSTTDDLSFVIPIPGEFIFYARFPMSPGSNPIRGLIKDDGTSASEIQNATWTGFQASEFTDNGVIIDRMIWIEGCGISGCGGSIVKSVDPTNGSELTLGIIPDDIGFINFFSTSAGAKQLTMGFSSSSLKNDVFFINPSQANSLTRITDTPSINEAQIGF